MAFELPPKGFVFWPVGTGDSTTIVVEEDETVMQVDLHHLAKSEDDDEPHTPIIDELERLLPKRNGRPYLAVFALTHPDKDHILGFEELLDRIDVGEIWHTPRIFREYDEDLCDDATKFKDEVERRSKLTIDNDGEVESGDRVRVIGHDDLFEDDDEYKDFPELWRSHPGKTITELDGEEYADVFEAFVHAPFKDSSAAERNEASLALQITLIDGDHSGKALLLGDLSYPTVKRIFDKTKEKERPERLEWNVLLAPHHCSKRVMYWKEEDDDEEQLKQDIMDDFEEAALDGAHVTSSSESDFSDEKGKNPPHAKARARYEEIVESDDHFICTHEHPNEDEPEPVKFKFGEDGFAYVEPSGERSQPSADLSATVSAARGTDMPPQKPVGFGQQS